MSLWPLGTGMCNWSLERQSSSPPDAVEHVNVAAVLFSLSYDSLPCTRLLNGVGVHMYISVCMNVCMYVCDQKKFEWHFSGQLTLSTIMVDFPL